MTTGDKTLPWEIGLDEYTTTDHPTTIERALSSINYDRLHVTLVSGSYKSAKTVLSGFDTKNIHFDRPSDWLESTSSAKVFYRDTFNVWNFFEVQIAHSTDDTIYSSHPKKVHRLQRRRHFRISPPEGSYASFIQDEQRFYSAMINNISAGGMLISTVSEEPFPDNQMQMNEILIKIPSKQKGSGTHMLLPIINQAKIVRSFSKDLDWVTYFAISFAGDHEVKDEISKYVMQREQEILRKDLKAGSKL